MTIMDAAALLICLAALLGYANYRWIHLPHTIGLTIGGGIAAVGAAALDRLLPGFGVGQATRRLLETVDFQNSFMNGMLSFLLFAGALHVDVGLLRARRWWVGLLTVAGVAISTVLVAAGFWAITRVAGLGVPFVWCLVFGALISPTDPVAVLGILKRAAVPAELSAVIAGESLFNDGFGVVVFATMLSLAEGQAGGSLGAAGLMLLREAAGGAALGLLTGALAYWAIKPIDEYNLEVLITLALVTGGYALAHVLGVNGPVAMAVAGLLIGHTGTRHAMSERTRQHLLPFWSLIDETLNSILFLLIGLDVLAVEVSGPVLAAALAAVPLALAARLVSVALPMAALARWTGFDPRALSILLWSGVRGGISVALAMGLPSGPVRDVALAATYAVVLFSVVVQGGTVGIAAERLFGRRH